jgi:hypothetical protein
MTVTLYRERVGRTSYYSISDSQELLFDGYGFSTVWGSDLNRGRRKDYTFQTRRQMRERCRKLISRRLADGYRLLYTFSRDAEHDLLASVVKETVG